MGRSTLAGKRARLPGGPLELIDRRLTRGATAGLLFELAERFSYGYGAALRLGAELPDVLLVRRRGIHRALWVVVLHVDGYPNRAVAAMAEPSSVIALRRELHREGWHYRGYCVDDRERLVAEEELHLCPDVRP
jgi:hypothetical protein